MIAWVRDAFGVQGSEQGPGELLRPRDRQGEPHRAARPQSQEGAHGQGHRRKHGRLDDGQLAPSGPSDRGPADGPAHQSFAA